MPYGIKYRSLAGSGASFIFGLIIESLLPATSPYAIYIGGVTALVLGYYALEDWLKKYILLYIPINWAASDVRIWWLQYLFRPTIKFSWDVEISNNSPRSLFCILDMESQYRDGITRCDFTNAYIELKQNGKMRRFYSRLEDQKISLNSMETIRKRLVSFQERENLEPLDESENFKIVLKGVGAQLIVGKDQTINTNVPPVHATRRLSNPESG